MSDLRAIVPCQHGNTGKCPMFLVTWRGKLPGPTDEWERCEGGREIVLRRPDWYGKDLDGAEPFSVWVEVEET